MRRNKMDFIELLNKEKTYFVLNSSVDYALEKIFPLSLSAFNFARVCSVQTSDIYIKKHKHDFETINIQKEHLENIPKTLSSGLFDFLYKSNEIFEFVNPSKEYSKMPEITKTKMKQFTDMFTDLENNIVDLYLTSNIFRESFNNEMKNSFYMTKLFEDKFVVKDYDLNHLTTGGFAKKRTSFR